MTARYPVQIIGANCSKAPSPKACLDQRLLPAHVFQVNLAEGGVQHGRACARETGLASTPVGKNNENQLFQCRADLPNNAEVEHLLGRDRMGGLNAQ